MKEWLIEKVSLILEGQSLQVCGLHVVGTRACIVGPEQSASILFIPPFLHRLLPLQSPAVLWGVHLHVCSLGFPISAFSSVSVTQGFSLVF